MKNMIINKILASNKVSFGKKDFKYFIGCKNAKKDRPSLRFIPKMSGYRKHLDETKYIYFLIKDDELLEKCNKFGKKLKQYQKRI